MSWPLARGAAGDLTPGAFGETSPAVRDLLRVTARAAAERHWREAGARGASAALSVYTATYRRRWGCAVALSGARLRLARRPTVEGQTAQAGRTAFTGFDPARHAHFTRAEVPIGRGPPLGQPRG